MVHLFIFAIEPHCVAQASLDSFHIHLMNAGITRGAHRVQTCHLYYLSTHCMCACTCAYLRVHKYHSVHVEVRG